MALVHMPLFTRQIAQYVSFHGDASWTGLISPMLENVQWTAPLAFSVRNLNWVIRNNAGTGKSWTITLLKNSIPTSLTSTIDGSSDTGTNATDEVQVLAGDKLIWLVEGETGEPAPVDINAISFEQAHPANQ